MQSGSRARSLIACSGAVAALLFFEVMSPGACQNIYLAYHCVGAHYDSVFDCPAANDNASGCAEAAGLRVMDFLKFF